MFWPFHFLNLFQSDAWETYGSTKDKPKHIPFHEFKLLTSKQIKAPFILAENNLYVENVFLEIVFQEDNSFSIIWL